jgi:PAS domain-containing protein
VSPLIDAVGKQTGWMTSMTDITEPNRIREQLQASHERFTTVLEALDASVSVAPLGSEELLFANKLYRLWFGTHTGRATCSWWRRPACPPPDQRRFAGRTWIHLCRPAHRHADDHARSRRTPKSLSPNWASGWRCVRAT